MEALAFATLGPAIPEAHSLAVALAVTFVDIQMGPRPNSIAVAWTPSSFSALSLVDTLNAETCASTSSEEDQLQQPWPANVRGARGVPVLAGGQADLTRQWHNARRLLHLHT